MMRAEGLRDGECALGWAESVKFGDHSCRFKCCMPRDWSECPVDHRVCELAELVKHWVEIRLDIALSGYQVRQESQLQKNRASTRRLSAISHTRLGIVKSQITIFAPPQQDTIRL